MVQRLRHHLPMQEVWLPSLVGELRSYMTCGQNSRMLKYKIRSNIVTNSIKTLKIAQNKEILKKKKKGGVGWAKVFFLPQTCS